MLLVLERHELTVSELCAVLQLPQSTVSRHLKTLADARWVIVPAGRHQPLLQPWRSKDSTRARAGCGRSFASRWPRPAAPSTMSGGCTACWRGGDRSRRSFSRRRRASGTGCAKSCSAQTFHLHALLGLLDPASVVGDLGCGTGQLSALVAPHVAQVIAVDSSPDMLHAARRRLARSGQRRFAQRQCWKRCRSMTRSSTWR